MQNDPMSKFFNKVWYNFSFEILLSYLINLFTILIFIWFLWLYMTKYSNVGEFISKLITDISPDIDYYEKFTEDIYSYIHIYMTKLTASWYVIAWDEFVPYNSPESRHIDEKRFLELANILSNEVFNKQLDNYSIFISEEIAKNGVIITDMKLQEALKKAKHKCFVEMFGNGWKKIWRDEKLLWYKR